jgi:hypothetical protein
MFLHNHTNLIKAAVHVFVATATMISIPACTDPDEPPSEPPLVDGKADGGETVLHVHGNGSTTYGPFFVADGGALWARVTQPGHSNMYVHVTSGTAFDPNDPEASGSFASCIKPANTPGWCSKRGPGPLSVSTDGFGEFDLTIVYDASRPAPTEEDNGTVATLSDEGDVNGTNDFRYFGPFTVASGGSLVARMYADAPVYLQTWHSPNTACTTWGAGPSTARECDERGPRT